MPLKRALITGIRGQDGSYLAQQLLTMGYEVLGTSHQFSGQHLLSEGGATVPVVSLDLTSGVAVRSIMQNYQPHEVYNLAARSSSAQLFDDPIATAEINGVAVIRFLDAIRQLTPETRFCQAASSEVFAGTQCTPQDECTPQKPLNAYGAAKAYAMNMVAAYRQNYNLHASTAILYNHESPRRGEEYVTRKISRAAAMIASRRESSLALGDIDSRRDWGFAADYAGAMALMLRQPHPDDFVIATGETHSVREFCEIAFDRVGLDYKKYVTTDERLMRRSETVELCGQSAKARRQLNWRPTISFRELVHMMVDAERGCLEKATNDLITRRTDVPSN